MATVDKNFKVKNGLVVEGTTATVNGEDVITTGSTTDDLGEGLTNLYYTEGRAKTDAAELLTGATLTNITITGDGDGLTITAENGGIQDLTGFDTDDLTEGTTNLYFTNQRALDATSAAYDAAGAAAAAQTAAEGYADTAIGALDTDDIEEGLTNLYFTNQRALDATSSAYDAAGAAAAAQTAAESYADGLAVNYDAAGAAAAAQTAAEGYTDTAIANLVDGAPALLDTLNELAAALGDDENFATTVANDIAAKQDTLTAGTGITIDQITDTISVTADTYDAFGAAAAAQAAAELYADGLAVNYEAAGAAQSAVDALDTDDIEEGLTNLYFTNQRALDATASAYDATGTAQGIVDALTTDDIEEGTSLYFTDARAVDALEAVVPDFTAVEVNSLAKHVAATATSLGSTAVTAYSFAKADYRTAKFVVKIDNGTDTEVTEVLLTLDSSDNIAITEYAIVGTNGTRGTITADVVLADVRLRVTPVNDSTINVVGTLLA